MGPRILITFLSIGFHTFVLIGLIMQSVIMGKLYFSYAVTTRVSITVPEEVPPHGITFCSKFTEIQKPGNHSSSTAKQTVSHMFDSTPIVDDLLMGCIFRMPGSYKEIEIWNKSAHDQFIIDKFLYQSNVCYRFSMKNSTTAKYTYYAVTPSKARFMWAIAFHPSSRIYRSNSIMIVMHPAHQYPHRSLEVAQVITRGYNETGVRLNHFASYSSLLKSRLLSPPYQTACANYSRIGLQDEADCLHTCVRQALVRKYNKVPLLGIIRDSQYSDYEILKPSASTRQEMDKCREECSKPDCNHVMTITKTSSIWFDLFALAAHVPEDPDIITEAAPALSLVEFMSYIMGSLATWTGLNFMALNPKYFCSHKTSSYERMQAEADLLFQRLYDIRLRLISMQNTRS